MLSIIIMDIGIKAIMVKIIGVDDLIVLLDWARSVLWIRKEADKPI